MSDTLFDPGEATGTASRDLAGVSTVGRPPVLCRLTPFGQPVAQGSMTPFIDRHSGRARVKPSNEKQLERWRRVIATEAERQAVSTGKLEGPLDVDIEFRFEMPASRPKATRDLGRFPMTVQPDIDKLVRAVLDALKMGGLIVDDRQVAAVAARKFEYVAGWLGADITIRRAAVLPLGVEP